MAGIMRGLLLEVAAAAGLHPREWSLTPADLATADEVFLTNSVRLLSPVAQLDGRPIGAGRGDAAAALLDAIAGRIREACDFDPRPSA